MKPPDFTYINDQELANVKLYPYKHLNAFKNTPKKSSKYNWHKTNVQGEMYEYLIYEKLLSWATTSENVSEFILKGPYIKRVTRSRNGLTYDRNNQIYYMSSGETICEFDALFKYDKYRIFIETKKMRIPSSLGKLKYDIERKYNLLQILFPNDDIGCWIVAPDQQNIKTAEFQNVKGIPTPIYKLNPEILKREDRKDQIESPNSTRFIYAHQCQHNRFHYFITLLNINERITSVEYQDINSTVKEVLGPYIGLIERVFLGKISVTDFNTLLEKRNQKPLGNSLNVKDVYPAIKVKGISSIANTIYLKSKDNHYFEISNLNNPVIKAIQRKKRAPRDIDRIDVHLKTLTLSQVEQYFNV